MEKTSCDCSRPSSGRPAPIMKGVDAPQVLSTRLSWRDRLGGWRVRWGLGRDRYSVEPGLYQIGTPDTSSPVLVTANYKLTVDKVRKELTGYSAWMLVLDTKGVNVWCAAGKGTFGTGELIRRVESSGLREVVEHRRLILPQLGAVGVAAHEITKATGFSVRYGPVLARDIPAYLSAGMKATPEMRRVPFGWRERIILIPVEMKAALKPALVIFLILALFEWLKNGSLSRHLAADLAPFLSAMLAGGVVTPLLLPWLPSRIFAVKGAIAGAVCLAVTLALFPGTLAESTGSALFGISWASYMGMMFTGSTTFTNLAGVRREVRWALPLIIVAAVLGSVLRIAVYIG